MSGGYVGPYNIITKKITKFLLLLCGNSGMMFDHIIIGTIVIASFSIQYNNIYLFNVVVAL